MSTVVQIPKKSERRRFAIYIDSINALSMHVWWWFTDGKHATMVRRQDVVPNMDMPHWSGFVAEMTREIERGEDLPWIKGAKPMSVPWYGDDWTLFLSTVDLHTLAERIVQREVVQLVRHVFDSSWPEPKWLCKCAGCRNFVVGRIKL
jgi:hypothetical protein